MSDIGSVSGLASYAAQPFQVGQTVSAGQVGGSGESPTAAGGSGAASGVAFAADYAMSLLAKITHASADQALALIKSMSVTPPR
jgi:hypothetical protein